MLDNARLVRELVELEHRTARGGRDTIDHARGGHDDTVNAVAGAVQLAAEMPAGWRRREQQDGWNVMTTVEAGVIRGWKIVETKLSSYTRTRLPGEPETVREYANDPGPRRWNKRTQAMREKRFASAPKFTAKR